MSTKARINERFCTFCVALFTLLASLIFGVPWSPSLFLGLLAGIIVFTFCDFLAVSIEEVAKTIGAQMEEKDGRGQ